MAAGGAELWNTAITPLLNAINQWPNGAGPINEGIFTGTTDTGLAYPGRYLGAGSSATTYIEDGYSNFGTTAPYNAWVQLGETFAVGQESYFGFSEVLTVPEPASSTLVLVGIGAVVGLRLMRRRCQSAARF